MFLAQKCPGHKSRMEHLSNLIRTRNKVNHSKNTEIFRLKKKKKKWKESKTSWNLKIDFQ